MSQHSNDNKPFTRRQITAHVADILCAAAAEPLIRYRGAFVAASAAGEPGAATFRATTTMRLAEVGLLSCRPRSRPFRFEATLTKRGRSLAAKLLADRADALEPIEAAE